MGEMEGVVASAISASEGGNVICGCLDCIRLKSDKRAHRSALSRYLRSFSAGASRTVGCIV